MIRRLPILPTLIVLIAAGVMIDLGLWQLDRREEKSALMAQYHSAAASDAVATWSGDEAQGLSLLYRRTKIGCAEPSAFSAIAGQNAVGDSGLAITARCETGALVVLGWTHQPIIPEWHGGTIAGIIAPGPRLVANPPHAGLTANAIPDPSSILNNHLSYALQWFFFASAALVIYGLALRKRLANNGSSG